MLVSGLLLPDVTVVLYDGSPKFPSFSALWELVDQLGVTFFGTSAPYLLACMKEGIEPSEIGRFEKTTNHRIDRRATSGGRFSLGL